MSASGSSVGAGNQAETPTLSGLAEKLDKLTLTTQRVTTKIQKIEANDAGVKESQRKLAKLPTPPKFKGNPADLEVWILQIRNYVEYNSVRFEDNESQTLFAGTLLEGVAARWYEPFLRRYYELQDADDEKEKELKDRYPDVEDMFKDIKKFFTGLKNEFGELDAGLRAEQRLLGLRQRTSVNDYATTFRIEASKTELGEEALVMLFYNGLKRHVIDEIYKLDRPKTLQAMVELATRVDNRYFDHQREYNRGRYDRPRVEETTKVRQWQKHDGNKFRKQDQRQSTPSTSFGTHSGPMDIGAAQANGRPTGRWNDKPRNDKSGSKCYNCDKPGHYARECRSPKKEAWKPVPEQKNTRFAAANDRYVRMTNSEDWYDDPTGDPKHEYPDSDLEQERQTFDSDDETRVEHNGPANDSPRNPAPEAVMAEEAVVENEEEEQEEGPQTLEQYLLTLQERSTGPSPSAQNDSTHDQEENIRGPGERHRIHDDWIHTDERQRVIKELGQALQHEKDLDRIADPEKKNGDAPQLEPSHEDHDQIAWFECYYPRCSEHKWQKLRYSISPAKNQHEPKTQVHDYDNDEEWNIRIRELHVWKDEYELQPNIRVIEARPTAPNDCTGRRITHQVCPDEKCRIHRHAKIEEWHSARARIWRLRLDNEQKAQDRRQWVRTRNELAWDVYGDFGTLDQTQTDLGNDQGGTHAPSGSL